MHSWLRRLPEGNCAQAWPEVPQHSAVDATCHAVLQCDRLPRCFVTYFADDWRRFNSVVVPLQATLMALFSLCRRLCARLQVGAGRCHWLITLAINCRC